MRRADASVVSQSMVVLALLWVVWPAGAWAQSSSLFRPPVDRSVGQDMTGYPSEVASAADPGFVAMPPRETSRPATRAIERMSLIAVPTIPPRKFKVHDLINIIVRQQKKYEGDGKLDTKKQWDVAGKLEDWFRFYPGNKLGQDQLSNGDPGFDFKFENRLKTDAESEREDKFVTRIQATIIDVKPNGNLVIEAQLRQEHDEEQFTLTLTGICRSDDVTPDNTVLSSQIAELTLVEKNQGAVRDSTRRGWIPRTLDWLRPF